MPSFDLILITDEGPDLVGRLTRALSAVPPRRVAVQLRTRQSTTREILGVALELRALTRARESTLLINDRVDIALAVEADGVQLPEAGLPIEVARKLLGSQRWVGVSRHDLKGLFEAARQGADYATLSPVHEVAAKGPPLGIAGFARTIAAVRLPVYALGGVRAADVAELRQSGARGIAVVREVLSAADPALATSELLSLLDSGTPG
ncbi:MAG: thiamine phosphate synthase [Myxococcales bacterium]